MNNLKYKIGFMVSMFLLISQGFFIPQCWCESDLEDMRMSVNSNNQDIQINNNQSQCYEIPATSGYQNNSKAVGKTGSMTSYAKLSDDLGDCDLSTKCYVLRAAGATSAEVQIVLVGKGYNSDDVTKALGGNKSNTSNTNNFLSGANNSQSASGNNNTVITTSSGTSGTSGNSNTVVQDPTLGSGATSSNNTQVINLTTGNNEDPNVVQPYSEDNKTQAGDVTVTDTRPGKANAEDIANIKQQLVDAQNLFKALGFDPKNITVDIIEDDGSGKGAGASPSADGGLHITLYVANGKDGHYTQGGGELQLGGMLHEYAHLVYETQSGRGWAQDTSTTDVSEDRALNEGFALYWGAQKGGPLPDLAGGPQDTPQKNADMNFAKALTSLAKDIGYDKANALVMATYSLMDGNFTFAGAKDALIKADQKLYGGANAQNIQNALAKV
jgi:hypothetical protein